MSVYRPWRKQRQVEVPMDDDGRPLHPYLVKVRRDVQFGVWRARVYERRTERCLATSRGHGSCDAAIRDGEHLARWLWRELGRA